MIQFQLLIKNCLTDLNYLGYISHQQGIIIKLESFSLLCRDQTLCNPHRHEKKLLEIKKMSFKRNLDVKTRKMIKA